MHRPTTRYDRYVAGLFAPRGLRGPYAGDSVALLATKDPSLDHIGLV